MFYFCSPIQYNVVMDFSIKVKDYSEVYVGGVSDLLPRLLPDKRVIVISDTNIDRYYHSVLEPFDHILIGLGESSKTLLTVDTIYRRLIELGADRSTFILGIGGGIVTDITGFVAATYMRGVEFGFVSTTLLGQVDASVGGKNGVNVDGYKNMVGTFRQPRFVICDVNMLRTLPKREFRSGLAEVIKSGIIADKELFEMLENADFAALQRDTALLQQIVYRAISVKASIVERDECETGDRRLLNLGHTLAHAIEKSSSKMNHGEAVAVGLSLIADIAARNSLLEQCDNERVQSVLNRVGFSLEAPVAKNQMLKAVSKDKKSEGNSIYVVLPRAIGRCEVAKMALEEFKALV